MAKVYQNGFKRRVPDLLTEAMVAVLSGKSSFEFVALFKSIQVKLQGPKLVQGSEEMLRLRTYEKLQQFVAQGAVKKTITGDVKKYKGLESWASLGVADSV